MAFIVGLVMAVMGGYALGLFIEQRTKMDRTAELITLFGVGYVAGWLSSVILGGGSLIRDTLVGIIGAVVGTQILKMAKIELGIGNQLARQVVTATLGAVLVTLAARLLG